MCTWKRASQPACIHPELWVPSSLPKLTGMHQQQRMSERNHSIPSMTASLLQVATLNYALSYFSTTGTKKTTERSESSTQLSWHSCSFVLLMSSEWRPNILVIPLASECHPELGSKHSVDVVVAFSACQLLLWEDQHSHHRMRQRHNRHTDCFHRIQEWVGAAFLQGI